jgi:hypothetical protein
MRYFIMVELNEQEVWGVEFGDYNEQVVLEEQDTYLDAGRIVSVYEVASDSQDTIDEFVKKLNNGEV